MTCTPSPPLSKPPCQVASQSVPAVAAAAVASPRTAAKNNPLTDRPIAFVPDECWTSGRPAPSWIDTPSGGLSMMLHTRKLGALEVPAIGLGCMGMSQSYGPADEKESLATLDRALELGCTFWDTAEAYGPHTNEELIGRALAGKRDRVTLATKFGFKFENGKQVPGAVDSRPENIR